MIEALHKLSQLSWEQWQDEVVRLLQLDFGFALGITTKADVDWPSWASFYQQGRSPRESIERALERDL